MKKTEKLMILISVVLVSLLAIGAVSAADTDTTAIGDEPAAEPTVEPAPIAEPDPVEKPTVSEDAGNFQKLDDEIVVGQINHEGNVTLDKDYENTDGHGITIQRQKDENDVEYDYVNLDGKDHIIDGSFNQTIFTIAPEMTVVMKNLIFINGQDDFGGAIVNYGDLTLINVTFMSNWAEDCGGAIYNDGKLTIINTTFIGNGAGSEEDYGYGGAIFNSADDEEFLLITNASFSDNEADFGGAIYNSGLGLALYKVGFFDNFADEDGGAIYNDESFVVLMDTVVFGGNAADGCGGAIFTEGDFISALNHAWFSDNSAGAFGGAICTNDEIMAINGTYFYNNTVNAPSSFTGKPEGGAIYGANLALAIANSTFEENSVTNALGKEGNGGAISATRVAVEDSWFLDNVAASEGGAIQTGAIAADNTVFTGNIANYGGAIYLGIYGKDIESESEIVDSYFGENIAAENGGAIYANSALTITTSEFEENAAIKGGAIYSSNVLNVYSSNFTENGLDEDYSFGGAIYQAAGENSKLLVGKIPSDANAAASNFVNDVAEYGSEIYAEEDVTSAKVGKANIVNVDGEESLIGVDTSSTTKFFIVTSLTYVPLNNETGTVAIMVYMFNDNSDDEDEGALMFGEKVNITMMDENGEIVFEDAENLIGTPFYPELFTDDLANGTYYLFIEYNGRSNYYESIFIDDEGFEVVNMTAVKEELESASYKEGKADGTEETTKLYENEIIPEIEKGYEDQIKAKNATIDDLTHQNDVLIEGNYLLNATNQNLTAENKKLATEKDDANKALAAKNAEATQLTIDKTNLQNQVNTLNSQLSTAQSANKEANAKIKKVKAASKVKKSKNFKITVTLNNNKVNGKYVYVAFNGKMYKAKVKNGKATITIKKSALKKLGGKTVKYQVVYDQSYKNKSVKVKK